MCRWLVYKGDRIVLEHLLLLPQNALMNQARHQVYCPGLRADPARNSQLNADGYGVAWYDRRIRDEPATFKTVLPAWNDLNLRDIASIVETTMLLAHVRAASPGSVISRENCHPFKMGRFSFMHNGGIAGFRQIRRTILQLLPDTLVNGIQGTTDSEHAFALFLHELGGSPRGSFTAEEIASAMERTIARILELQLAAGITSPSSLNFAVTDGITVVATRFRNSLYEDPPSLYYSYGSDFQLTAPDTYRMGRSDPRDTIIISSEPLTYMLEDWSLVPANHLVIAHPAAAGAPHPDAVSAVTVHPIRVAWQGVFGLAPSISPVVGLTLFGAGEPVDEQCVASPPRFPPAVEVLQAAAAGPRAALDWPTAGLGAEVIPAESDDGESDDGDIATCAAPAAVARRALASPSALRRPSTQSAAAAAAAISAAAAAALATNPSRRNSRATVSSTRGCPSPGVSAVAGAAAAAAPRAGSPSAGGPRAAEPDGGSPTGTISPTSPGAAAGGGSGGGGGATAAAAVAVAGTRSGGSAPGSAGAEAEPPLPPPLLWTGHSSRDPLPPPIEPVRPPSFKADDVELCL